MRWTGKGVKNTGPGKEKYPLTDGVELCREFRAWGIVTQWRRLVYRPETTDSIRSTN